MQLDIFPFTGPKATPSNRAVIMKEMTTINTANVPKVPRNGKISNCILTNPPDYANCRKATRMWHKRIATVPEWAA
jgi:hypothetical protein